MSHDLVIIGIGNMYRGDDAVGLMVADELERSGIRTIKCRGDATELMETWEGYTKAIIIDACPYMEEVGKIYRIDINEDEDILINAVRTSSHNFGLSEAIELSKLLKSLPDEVIIYAIEGEKFNNGDDISNKVKAAVLRACEQIKNEITRGE